MDLKVLHTTSFLNLLQPSFPKERVGTERFQAMSSFGANPFYFWIHPTSTGTEHLKFTNNI